MATDLSELRLHVRYDEGSGPLLVFLHGINSDGTDWRPVIDRIGPGYRCIAFDLLGFGLSPKPTDVAYSADDHCRVIAATLHDLGITERFVLVGYSLGGDIAIRYASTYPDRLRRLFLLSAPFYLPADAFARRKFGPEFFQALMFEGIWNALARQKERDGVVYSLASGRLEEFAKGFMRTDDISEHWDIMSANLLNCIGAATFVDDLPRLTMPVVFALGVRDPIVRPDQTPALKRLKPDIEIRRIAGLSADHFMLLNIPERVADEILADEIGRLNVARRHGSGEPIVLLHGIEDGAERLAPLAIGLEAGGADVTVLDLLGFGASPQPLSSHYTVEDHAAAVLGTLKTLFGSRAVRLMGHGLGAVVALECAAERPAAVTDVVALAPALIPPGMSGGDLADDPTVARVLGMREAYVALARDERMQNIFSERIERETVPAVRSIDALLTVDAAALVERVRVPVRWVLPAEGPAQAWGWLVERANVCPADTFAHPEAPFDMAYSLPLEALRAIGDVSDRQVDAIRSVPALSARRRSRLSAGLGSLSAQFARRGTLMLLGGLLLLLWPQPLSPNTVTVVLALWLLVEAIQTIVGAWGLKRAGKSWVTWLLLGGVSLAFALAVALRDSLGALVAGIVIAGWLAARGVTNLYVAWRTAGIPIQRWTLVVEGVAALGLFALIFIEPQVAGRLLRYWLGGYLAFSGIASIGSAWWIHSETRRRIRRFTQVALDTP